MMPTYTPSQGRGTKGAMNGKLSKDDVNLLQSHDKSVQSGGFVRTASAASLHDAHVGQAGMLALSEEAVSASIQASMHTPTKSENVERNVGDLVANNLIVGEPSVITSSPSRTSLTPARDFNYPLADIKIANHLPDRLDFNRDFQDVKHIADGSNANIYQAKFEGRIVVIKMIKEKYQFHKGVTREFDTEYCILIRLNHPNIIKVLGAGRNPRRFTVLEYLSGGTLQSLLNNHDPGRQGLAARLLHKSIFRSHAFTYSESLGKIKDLASALLYLHEGVQNDVTIIHRDLKPDNIGFTEEGVLKVFDFGLCTCVHSRKTPTDVYEMTGATGSIRYMAPEVSRKLPYTELVDVYSFSILAWQILKDKVPFRGMNKASFTVEVIQKGVRPKIDPSWPTQLSTLLQSCWHVDYMKRPSFKDVLRQLDELIAEDEVKSNSKSPGGGFLNFSPKASQPKTDRTKAGPSKSESSWF